MFSVILFRGKLFDRAKGIHPGVVNQDVEFAVNLFRFREQLIDGCLVRNIGTDCYCFATS